MTQPTFDQLRQRAEYTHKYNLNTGRHGWLRLTPAYSVRVVEELLSRYHGRLRVLDPFCGTATTALSAAYLGHHSLTTDVNPFLVWLGKAKTAHYSPETIAAARDACSAALSLVEAGTIDPGPPPPIHNVERWWSPDALAFLCRLQAAITTAAPAQGHETALLRVAFCRTLIACSNAAFNHQSMSFKRDPQPMLPIDHDFAGLFRQSVSFVLRGALDNPTGSAEVVLHDARKLSELDTEPFDLVVTSPPYANRMSYIRELRPYMYWLSFLVNGRDAGELDWRAIGGTWGVATSRLNEWKPDKDAYTSEYLEATLSRIANPANANGVLLATYVRKYCVDMAEHFAELRTVLTPQARIHYIIGNSTFYGELLSAEKLYVDMLTRVGFSEIRIQPIRKRNSKKELVEFDVSARWQ